MMFNIMSNASDILERENDTLRCGERVRESTKRSETLQQVICGIRKMSSVSKYDGCKCPFPVSYRRGSGDGGVESRTEVTDWEYVARMN